MPPTENDIFPPIQTHDQNNNPIALTDYAKTPILLFIYPRADTSGCTLEACAFRDLYAEIRATGTTLLGLSRDTVKAQKKFADKFSFPYPLLADPDETIVNALGLIKPKNMYGKLVKGVERTTYLIAPADPEGHQRIQKIWSKVKPEGHAEEVLAYLKSL